MTVQSRPTKPKQSAIVSRATLDRQRGAFERLSAFVVLFFSFAGTIAALSGGWTALRTNPQIAPILGGIAAQGIFTVVEWWYGSGRGPWRYRLALCADSALTALGYGPLIVPWLSGYLADKGLGELAVIVAWCIIGAASLAIAWYPERQLID
jgi:hypothetical protein